MLDLFFQSLTRCQQKYLTDMRRRKQQAGDATVSAGGASSAQADVPEPQLKKRKIEAAPSAQADGPDLKKGKTEQASSSPPTGPDPKTGNNDPVFDLSSAKGITDLITEAFPAEDLQALDGSIPEFDGLLDLFVSWIVSTKPKQISLASQFRNSSWDKGDFATAKARKAWYSFWKKEYKQRFISLSDLKKSGAQK